MPVNDPILTISVAAKLLGLHPRTLMLYEEAGFVTPHRTKTKRRLFSIKDLSKLQFIKYLTQKEGVNLNGVTLLLKAIKFGKENGINIKRRLFPAFKLNKLI